MNRRFFIPLDPLATLRAHGADADTFLQGQLSNDLRALTPERGQFSSFNSAKGRMLAIFHLLRDGSDVLLELPDEIADITLKRLRMFVLRAAVTLENISPQYAAVGLIGSAANDQLAQLQLPVPSQPMDCIRDHARGITVFRRHGQTPRFSLHAPRAVLTALMPLLGEPAPYCAWQRAQIEAGEPVIYNATRDHFVPQMANLDQLGGISFDKGCYTGQEIVARLHYLGQIKRRLYLCSSEGARPPPGAEVLCAGAVIGEVVDAVDTSAGTLFSAVLQTTFAERTDLHLADTRAVQVRKAPGT